ncbi:Hypothetical predicted protein [Mytilus galloprovincialis]|uniref:SWIM-type domain-containing protein n=1 Tax=Mytilus galloprovincialis TaxID=29158 RepID=A0A8B6EIQ5_MYTGA|nr:Hypothetical predicted protein [Mytilus galloprovincialis]
MFYLQTYYTTEIQRGLAGVGNYSLRVQYLHAKIPKDEISIPKHLLKPDDIVQHVMGEIDTIREDCTTEQDSNADREKKSDSVENELVDTDLVDTDVVTTTDTILQSEEVEEGKIVSNENTLQDKDLTQKSLARLAVENGHVTFVQQQRAFMVKGTQGTNYAVTLLPKETCQCPSTTHCYHIIAAKLFIGDEIDSKTKIVNLRRLNRKNLKRNDKKSGRKKPRANDYDIDVVPAPDSEAVATEISSPPCSPVSLSPRTPKQLKTPTVKTPCTGKRLRFADKQADIQPISPRFTCPLPVKKRKLSMQNFSDKTPWVSGLTLEHKNKILTNTWLCSDIINTCTDIVQTQFPGIAGFQATTLAPRFNENTKSWTQDFGTFQSKQAPCVQIHHTGKSHWVTSLQQTRDTTVYVLDSLNSLHTITASLEIQLAAIYGDKKKKLQRENTRSATTIEWK